MVLLLSKGIVSCYIDVDGANYLYTVNALKKFSLAFIFMGNVVITSAFFSSEEKSFASLVISLLRGIILPVAFLYLISMVLDAEYIWYSCLLSEFTSLVICFVVNKESFAF